MENILKSYERLTFLLNTIPPLLEKINEDEFSLKPSPSQWSKKEILGHLIDSATNNHQRFIRIQYEHEPVIFYDQNSWNQLSHYNDLSTVHLIIFWKSYNLHLAEIIKLISHKNLYRCGLGKDGQKFPLHFYVEDYIQHLEHHLRQIVNF